MSQADVEKVRRMHEAFERREPEVAIEFIHPDIEWDTTRVFPDGRVYRGREGVNEFFRQWVGTWDSYATAAEQYIDAGDRVLVRLYQRGTGRGSGVPVELRFVAAYELTGGMMIRMRCYRTEGEALAAAEEEASER